MENGEASIIKMKKDLKLSCKSSVHADRIVHVQCSSVVYVLIQVHITNSVKRFPKRSKINFGANW